MCGPFGSATAITIALMLAGFRFLKCPRRRTQCRAGGHHVIDQRHMLVAQFRTVEQSESAAEIFGPFRLGVQRDLGFGLSRAA